MSKKGLELKLDFWITKTKTGGSGSPAFTQTPMKKKGIELHLSASSLAVDSHFPLKLMAPSQYLHSVQLRTNNVIPTHHRYRAFLWPEHKKVLAYTGKQRKHIQVTRGPLHLCRQACTSPSHSSTPPLSRGRHPQRGSGPVEQVHVHT